MDSKHLAYERFAEKIIDSFHEFLSELERSDSGATDCPFVSKLHDIDTILQKLFVKFDSPSQNTPQVKQIPACSEPIPSKIKISKEMTDKKRKTSDLNHTDDFYERMKMYISRDVDESDNSDCEMKSVPINSETLFKTDYPAECFLPEEKRENEVSCQDVSSSLNKSLITSIEDDPYIKKLNPEKPNVESNVDMHDQNNPDPYIIKIIEDVYKCQLCLINNLPQNNVAPHVNGRQHRNALLKLKETADSLKVVPKVNVPIVASYECTLCKTEINCRENVLQHLNGRQHNRKLETVRVNV